MAREYNRPVAPVDFQPQASPVSRPIAEPPKSAAANLADALGQLSPHLQSLAQVFQQRENEQDKAKGEQLARELQESGETWSTAIAKKKVPPSASPWFRAGLQEQYGRLTADKMASDLTAWAITGIRSGTITSMEDYDRQVQQVRSEWLKENIPEGSRSSFFEQGFGRNSDQAIADLRGKAASQLDSQLQAQQIDQHSAETYSAMVQIRSNHPGETWESIGYEQIGQAFDMLANNARKLNPLAGRSIQQATVDGIVAYAKSTGDVTALDILNHIHGQGNSILGYTKYARDQIEKASDDIAQEQTARQRAKDAAAKIEADNIAREMLAYKRANPLATLADAQPFITRMEQVSPWQADGLVALWNDAAKQADIPENFQRKRDLFYNVYKGMAGSDEVLTALHENAINTGTANTLMDILASPALRSNTLAIFSEKPLTDAKASIKDAMYSWLALDTNELRSRSNGAKAEFEAKYLDWRLGAGKDADPKQIHSFVSKTYMEVMSKWATPEVLQAMRRAQTAEGKLPVPPPVTPNTDPAAGPVAGGETYRTMITELEGYTTGTVSRLSDSTLDQLRRSGVDPRSPAAVRQFLALQKLHAQQVNNLDADSIGADADSLTTP